MSTKQSSRRTVLLGVFALLLAAGAVWSYTRTGGGPGDGESTRKADELRDRYEAAGGSTREQGDAEEPSEPVQGKGPVQSDG